MPLKKVYANATQEAWYRSRDWGWTLSRQLVDDFARKSGRSVREADWLYSVLCKEIVKTLISGKAVGIPGVGTIYPSMRQSCSSHKNVQGPNAKIVNVHWMLRIKTSKPFRTKIRNVDVPKRGTLNAQYEKTRAHVVGSARTRPVKGAVTSTGLRVLTKKELEE